MIISSFAPKGMIIRGKTIISVIAHWTSCPKYIYIFYPIKSSNYHIKKTEHGPFKRFKLGSWINFQSLDHHSSVLLDQIPLQLYKEGIKEREDGERGGGGGRGLGAIIRGRRLF